MSGYNTFGEGPEGYDDDAEGVQADARELADEQAEFPERYGLCGYCGEPIDPEYHLCVVRGKTITNIFASIRLNRDEPKDTGE